MELGQELFFVNYTYLKLISGNNGRILGISIYHTVFSITRTLMDVFFTFMYPFMSTSVFQKPVLSQVEPYLLTHHCPSKSYISALAPSTIDPSDGQLIILKQSQILNLRMSNKSQISVSEKKISNIQASKIDR